MATTGKVDVRRRSPHAVTESMQPGHSGNAPRDLGENLGKSPLDNLNRGVTVDGTLTLAQYYEARGYDRPTEWPT